MNVNEYAVFKNETKIFLNPNCYYNPASKGTTINGFECIFVGTFEDCKKIVDENSKEEFFNWDCL